MQNNTFYRKLTLYIHQKETNLAYNLLITVILGYNKHLHELIITSLN